MMKTPRCVIASRRMLLLLTVVIGGCQRPANPAAPVAAVEHIHDQSLTAWTGQSEIYLAYPALRRNVTAGAVLHWTRLADGKPVALRDGWLRLSGGGFMAEFALTAGAPGISTAPVRMARAGKFSLSAEIGAEGLRESVNLGEVTVHEGAAPHDEAEPTGILVTKEQQWTLELSTSAVGMRRLRAGLRVPAEARARSAGEMEVAAPFAGRLVAVQAMAAGTKVEEGQTLASVLPPTSSPADLASLEQARAESAAALEYARKDRQRAERLVEGGAASARRLDEARALEQAAAARNQAAVIRLAQYESSTMAQAESPGAKAFAIRAPIAGILAEVHAAPGKNVSAGELLYRVIDPERIQIAAIVPESDRAKVLRLSGAELEVPGREGRVPLGRPSWVGSLVDPSTRSFPVLFPFDNRRVGVAIRQTLAVWLYYGGAESRPAIPEAAIVDDNGQPVVYIQQTGERFERRTVSLGARESGWVEVAAGLNAGERVVTRNAFLVRLASLSSAVPAEGHVH